MVANYLGVIHYCQPNSRVYKEYTFLKLPPPQKVYNNFELSRQKYNHSETNERERNIKGCFVDFCVLGKYGGSFGNPYMFNLGKYGDRFGNSYMLIKSVR